MLESPRPERETALRRNGENALSHPNSDNPSEGGSSPWLLFLGAAIGLALAAYGLLENSSPVRLPSDAAAIVGEQIIRRIDYERVLAGVEGDLRNPIDDSTRRRVLDRMIDEELLVQRALALGLAAIDRRVRGELTSGLIDSIVSEADANRPTDQDVVRHFEENIGFFSRPGKIHAQTMFFSARHDESHPIGTAAERAEEALVQLRQNGNLKQIERTLGDPQISPLPNGLLPRSKIRDYVGPIVLKRIEKLQPGEWSEFITSGSGIVLAKMIQREELVVPPFETIEALVRQDLRRRRGDEALRRYLDDLRGETTVMIDEDLFDSAKPSEKD